MPFRLLIQPTPEMQLQELERRAPKKHRKVLRCLGLLESAPRHPGLNSHRFESCDSVYGQEIWESYVENQTPGAYRLFWHYGPDEGEITVVAITPHP